MSTGKEGAIAEIVEFLIRSHGVSMDMYEELLDAVLTREAQMSTGIGNGIAVPHGIVDLEGAPYIWGSIGISREGIRFDSLDEEPGHMVILVITPEEHREKHLKVLAEISRMMKKKETREAVFNASTASEIYEIFRELEMEGFNYFVD